MPNNDDRFNIWIILFWVLALVVMASRITENDDYKKAYKEGYASGHQARIDYEHGKDPKVDP